jgi:hypothetical protein
MVLTLLVGAALTFLMVGGFSYVSRGWVYDWFAPIASKDVMRRANARTTTKSSYRRY